jgi:predicted RND superfamily exporter protein
MLVRVGNFDRQYRIPIMIVAGLLVVPCLWGISRIRADLNFIEYFRKSSPVRQANEIIGEKIGGTQNFDVIVDSGKKGGALTFDLFRRIKGLQTYLAVMPGVDQTLSIVDYGQLLDRAIQNNGTGRRPPAAHPGTYRRAFGKILSDFTGSPSWYM